jgi:hypothetical protein
MKRPIFFTFFRSMKSSGNHMNERELRMDSLRSLAGIPKNPFRVRVQANRETHSRCPSCLGEMVSACCVFSTGQSTSFNTFAVVEPSNVLQKRPACVGMMMRSNPFVWAS